MHPPDTRVRTPLRQACESCYARGVNEPFGIAGDDYRLRPEDIEAFGRDGYVTLRDVVTEDELAALEPHFEPFLAGRATGMGRDYCDMSGPYGRPFDDWNLINAVLVRRYRPELCENIYERRAASIARQLIGPDAVLDYDQFLAKRPRRPGAAFAWHQDLGYWPTGTPDTRTATCSLALDDATADNGCLRVVPGSHREQRLRPHRPLVPAEAPRDGAHTLAIELRSDDSVALLPVARGSLTVHDERIVHGSGGNPSDRWRRTYVVAFRSRATVAYERSIGFTHSHNDRIAWTTHLEALDAN